MWFPQIIYTKHKQIDLHHFESKTSISYRLLWQLLFSRQNRRIKHAGDCFCLHWSIGAVHNHYNDIHGVWPRRRLLFLRMSFFLGVRPRARLIVVLSQNNYIKKDMCALFKVQTCWIPAFGEVCTMFLGPLLSGPPRPNLKLDLDPNLGDL